MPETGLNLPAHASALGKVLLAYNPELERDVLSKPLADLTGDTITDPAMLRTQLEEVRKNGLGLEYGEALIGEDSIAAPVYDDSGNVVAVLSVVFPASAWPANETTIRELREAAWTISRELGAPGWSSPLGR